MSLQKLTKETFDAAVKVDTPVLVKYYMDGCGPCKMMAPIVEKLSESTQGIAFFEVNTDNNPSLARDARLTGVPVLILYNGGKELNRISGFNSEADVIAFIDKNVHK